MNKQKYLEIMYNIYENYFNEENTINSKISYVSKIEGVIKCAYEDNEVSNVDYLDLEETQNKYATWIMLDIFNGDKL